MVLKLMFVRQYFWVLLWINKCANPSLILFPHRAQTYTSISPSHTIPSACHPPPGESLELGAGCPCQAASGWSRCTHDCCHSNRGSLARGGLLVSPSQKSHIQLDRREVKWYMTFYLAYDPPNNTPKHAAGSCWESGGTDYTWGTSTLFE